MGASTVIAIFALFVSVFSASVAVLMGARQWKHMKLSVRPIAAVTTADSENRIGVFIRNNGLGPMLVRTLRVTDGAVTHERVVDHMPSLPAGIGWTKAHSSIDGFWLQVGKRFRLLLLEGYPDNKEFERARDNVRKKLSSLVIHVRYEDLYGQKMYTLEKKLSCFGGVMLG